MNAEEPTPAAGAAVPQGDVAWERETLEALIAHIVHEHHAYSREALDRLAPLAAQVAKLHGAQHPSLGELVGFIAALDVDLRLHMTKEEHVLFPYIQRLASATEAGRRPEVSPFGTVENPVRTMMREHDHCSGLLQSIRKATSNYELPPDASAPFAALYSTLEELERDLLQHIHLESNILFPKAMALEAST